MAVAAATAAALVGLTRKEPGVAAAFWRGSVSHRVEAGGSEDGGCWSPARDWLLGKGTLAAF